MSNFPPDSEASPSWNVRIASPPSSSIRSKFETKETFGAVSLSCSVYETTASLAVNSIFSAALTSTLIVSSCSYTPSSITERVKVPDASPAGILNLLIKSIFLKLPLFWLWVKNNPDAFTSNCVGLSILASLTIPSTVPESLFESTKVYKSPSTVYL